LKLEDYQFSPTLNKDIELREVITNIKDIINNGRYQMRVLDGYPTWTGEEGEAVFVSSGGVYRLYVYASNGWRYVAFT